MTDDDIEFFVAARIADSVRLLELASVREIVPVLQLATPDGVGGICRGIANVRGEVVPVFDVAGRDTPLEPSQMIVLAQGMRGTSVGILVDDVLDIVQLPRLSVVAHASGHGRVVRSVNWQGQTVTVLTTAEILDAA